MTEDCTSCILIEVWIGRLLPCLQQYKRVTKYEDTSMPGRRVRKADGTVQGVDERPLVEAAQAATDHLAPFLQP